MHFIAFLVLVLSSSALASSETPIIGVAAGDIYEDMMKEPVVRVAAAVRRKSGVVVCQKVDQSNGEAGYFCANKYAGRTDETLDYSGESAGILYRNIPVPEIKISATERKKTGYAVCTRSDYMVGETEYDCVTYPLK